MAARETRSNAQPAAGAAALCRDVNDRIRELGTLGDAEPCDFVCECDDIRCLGPVTLTLAAYDAQREGGASVVSHGRERQSDGLVDERPRLLFFFSATSGLTRRVDGFLAQVLQRRANHSTFVIHRIDVDQRPDLVERLRVTELPALVVVTDGRVRARLSKPKGCTQIAAHLAPWLK
jgi:hypothetical protein